MKYLTSEGGNSVFVVLPQKCLNVFDLTNKEKSCIYCWFKYTQFGRRKAGLENHIKDQLHLSFPFCLSVNELANKISEKAIKSANFEEPIETF